MFQLKTMMNDFIVPLESLIESDNVYVKVCINVDLENYNKIV